MDRLIFHIDVNNAFLSWSACEMLKKGNTKDIRKEVCVIGGSEEKRSGIVLAKSTPAKKYGIITAETLFSAKKKYPGLKIYPPTYEAYYKYSWELCEYFKTLTPLIEQYSIDECFLDFTGIKQYYIDPVESANNIRETIKKNFGYTVNIGIANNKLCAKMASDFEKPDKVHTLFNNEIKDKLWHLDVDDLFMVGKKTAIKLHEMNIKTIGELSKISKDELISRFKKQGEMLFNYSRGIDNSKLESNFDLKGIGNSFTYPYDLDNIVDIKNKLLQLSSIVGRRLRRDNKKGKVVTLWIKYSNFNSITKQIKLDKSIFSDKDIYDVSVKIIKKVKIEPIRSLGIRLTDFDNNNKQISIFDKEELKKDDNIDFIIDNLKDKYGESIIKKGI